MRENYIFSIASAPEQALMRLIAMPPARHSEHGMYLHRFDKLAASCTNLNAFDGETGHAPIHQLVESISHPSLLAPLINRLLAGGVDIDAHDISGDTALHVAIRMANIHACRILLDRGAQPNLAVFGTRCHPLDLVIDAMRYPESGDPKPGMVDVLRALVSRGSKVPLSSNCLILAAGGNDHGLQSDLPEVIDLLVGAGAAVDVPEKLTNRRAIHYAAMRGHWQAASRLFAAGADALGPDGSGSLPFNYAEQFSAHSHELRAVIRAAEMKSIIQMGDARTTRSVQSTTQPAAQMSVKRAKIADPFAT